MAFLNGWLANVSINKNVPATAVAIAHPDILKQMMMSRRYAALGEFSGIIVKDRVLESPTGVFKGINRPLHSNGVDNFVFIYVSKPSLTYKFTCSDRPADILLPPKNSVFVTYLTLNRSVINSVQTATQSPLGAFRGVILGWEWVPESPTAWGLPIDHSKRYKGRLWK